MTGCYWLKQRDIEGRYTCCCGKLKAQVYFEEIQRPSGKVCVSEGLCVLGNMLEGNALKRENARGKRGQSVPESRARHA